MSQSTYLHRRLGRHKPPTTDPPRGATTLRSRVGWTLGRRRAHRGDGPTVLPNGSGLIRECQECGQRACRMSNAVRARRVRWLRTAVSGLQAPTHRVPFGWQLSRHLGEVSAALTTWSELLLNDGCWSVRWSGRAGARPANAARDRKEARAPMGARGPASGLCDCANSSPGGYPKHAAFKRTTSPHQRQSLDLGPSGSHDCKLSAGCDTGHVEWPARSTNSVRRDIAVTASGATRSASDASR